MAERSEVRVSDQDAEMLAIKALTAALSGLDSRAASRVLDWADARFGHGAAKERARAAKDAISDYEGAILDWVKNVTKAMEATNAAAARLGVSGKDFTMVLERAYREAAAEDDPEGQA